MEEKNYTNYGKIGQHGPQGAPGVDGDAPQGYLGDKGASGDSGVNPDGTPFNRSVIQEINPPIQTQKIPGEENSEKVSEQPPATGTYITKFVTNIRSETLTTSEVVRTVPAGTYLTAVGPIVLDEWVNVGDGWTRVKYLKKI